MDDNEPDRSYFARRELEELAAAGRCRSDAGRRAHEDLARRYRQAAIDGSIPMAEGVSGERIARDPFGDDPFAEDGRGMMPLLTPEFRILN
jgi:hypothetical protein